MSSGCLERFKRGEAAMIPVSSPKGIPKVLSCSARLIHRTIFNSLCITVIFLMVLRKRRLRRLEWLCPSVHASAYLVFGEECLSFISRIL